MSKYDIFVPAGEKRPAIRIMEHGKDTYFAGYDFMGSVDWSDDISQAERFDTLDEARQIVSDLEAADAPADPPRACAGYLIIQSLRLDPAHELVIGHNPRAAAPYVCWDCTNGDDYNNGGYAATFRQSLLILAERIQNRYNYLPFEYHC